PEYHGASGDDSATGGGADGMDRPRGVGRTASTNLPTTSNARQRTAKGNGDAFVVKFNAAGGVVYSTYLGGTGNDIASSVALDQDDNVYVGGVTLSLNFPTTASAIQTTRSGAADAFITKMTSAAAIAAS